MRTVREVSAGGVIYRRHQRRFEVALIHVRKRWGLPKGHAEKGERYEDTAAREVREETGLSGVLDGKLGQIGYSYRDRSKKGEPIKISKRVHFFLLRYLEGEVHGHDREVDEARWFPIDEAIAKLSFATERKILRIAKGLIEAEPSRAVNGGSQSARQKQQELWKMRDDSTGVTFSVPYEIAVVRPLRQTTLSERAEALEAVYYNTELIPQELIYVDLKTDSGVSSFSTTQLSKLVGAGPLESGMEMAAEGNKAFVTLAERFQKFFGFPFIVPVAQGRAAERIWVELHVKQGAVVPGNMLFPSTRFHIESNGGKVVDVIAEAAHDLDSAEPFKGNVDPKKLEAVFKEQGNRVACVYVELCVNSCGGHPVSLANLKEIKAIAAANRTPLFFDACRILENSYLIKVREPGYRNRSLEEIVQETCSLAEGCTMSALKDFLVPAGGFIATRDEASYQKAALQNFLGGSQPSSAAMEMMSTAMREIFANESYIAGRVEQVDYLWRRLSGGIPVLTPAGGHGVFIDAKSFLPHVAAENFPAEALAAFIYHMAGIRVAKGPPLAPSQTARGVELLRLAVPARRYLKGHMDDVAEAVLYAYAHRDEIKGLKKVERPGRSRFDPALFAPV